MVYSVSMTVTEIETPVNTLDATQAGSSILFTQNMDAYKRIARASRAAWKNGDNPLAGYLITDETFTTRPFGIEIEFNSDDILITADYDGCLDDCCNDGDIDPEEGGFITPVGQWLCDNHYTDMAEGSEYHANDGDYSFWRYESDATVTGGEIVSPVMPGSGTSWKTISEVMDAVNTLGGSADARNCGGHISVDVSDFGLEDVKRLARLAAKFEDVMYRLGTNPHRADRSENGDGISRHRGMFHALPLMERALAQVSDLDARYMGDVLNRGVWLNYEGHNDRLEFRIFDGTLDAATSQTFAMIASAFTDAAKRDETDEILADMPDRLRGWHIKERKDAGLKARSNVSGEAWEKDTQAIREFVDLLFTDIQDKERVITLFAGNDWNYAPR